MKKTLVVMAAGMGSRFGGLKQIEPVGPNGEFIIDYSVYDAKKAGFDKVVFVIKKELESIFKETIGKRIENFIEVSYAFQEKEDVPSKEYLVPLREKPWGTVQAVKVARPFVEGDFAVINADDFYGYDSYLKASQFLDNSHNDKEYACITYPFNVVSSKYGSVKRGVCYTDGEYITELVESKVELVGDHAEAEELATGKKFDIPVTQPVSMNMFAFKKGLFAYLNDAFIKYFENSDEEILKGESLLPELIKELLENKEITLKNVISNGMWYGITYREDLEGLKISIQNLIDSGVYPNKLW